MLSSTPTPQTASPLPISSLSTEMYVKIFSYFTPRERSTLSSVEKKNWQTCANDSAAWKRFLNLPLPNDPPPFTAITAENLPTDKELQAAWHVRHAYGMEYYDLTGDDAELERKLNSPFYTPADEKF